jgi:hypothetical protein
MVKEKLDKSSVGKDFLSGLFAAIEMPMGPIYFVFCRLYPFPLSHHGSVWVLPVISLLLSCIAGAGLPNHMMGEVSWDRKRRRAWVS